MTGIDFADTIVVRRVVNKGTKIVEERVDKSPTLFSDDLKKQGLERLKLAGDMMVISGKGTSKIRLSEMPETKVVLPKGLYISTGKGTGRVKIS